MYERPKPNFDWPDEVVDRFKKLWADGLSASIIAAQLGNSLTRNAVIGKAYRLDLPGRVTRQRMQGSVTARKNRTYRRQPQPQAKPLTPLEKLIREGSPLPPKAETDVARVSFSDFERRQHCSFIPDNPGDAFKLDKLMYCGLKPVLGLPYCEHHARRCYDAPRTSASNRAYLVRDEQHAAHVTPKVFA